MQTLQKLNYSEFSASELCHYLEERQYPKILSDLEVIHNNFNQFKIHSIEEVEELAAIVFNKLHFEVKQLFIKDSILIFPTLMKYEKLLISLAPINAIHQRIIHIFHQLRRLMNNFIPLPNWSIQLKICCNELADVEQSLQNILYIKENFLWTKINHTTSNG